jgi:hypothetical protein
LVFGNLSFHLFEPDEGRYAEIPREMLTRGDWIVPYLQGEPYLDKPPMLYWLVMISYKVFGIHDWSARLVPAFALEGCILLTLAFGRRWFGERAAFWSSLLLSLAPGFVSMGRLLIMDGLLTLWVTLSLCAAYEAIRGDRLKPTWWLVSACACGLGLLTKGPVALLLLIPPCLAYCCLHSQLNRLRWYWLGLFVAVCLAIPLPWYVAICLRSPGSGQLAFGANGSLPSLHATRNRSQALGAVSFRSARRWLVLVFLFDVGMQTSNLHHARISDADAGMWCVPCSESMAEWEIDQSICDRDVFDRVRRPQHRLAMVRGLPRSGQPACRITRLLPGSSDSASLLSEELRFGVVLRRPRRLTQLPQQADPSLDPVPPTAAPHRSDLHPSALS